MMKIGDHVEWWGLDWIIERIEMCPTPHIDTGKPQVPFAVLKRVGDLTIRGPKSNWVDVSLLKPT